MGKRYVRLNIGNLKASSVDLLGKWWWCFKVEGNSLWVKVIKSIYRDDGGLRDGVIGWIIVEALGVVLSKWMALPTQNITHSALRSMLEREKLSSINFNYWFRQLRIVLRVEKKLNATEQPIPLAPFADANNKKLEGWNKIYDVHNKEHKSMFEKQAGVERFDLIQTFYTCKQEEGKFVSSFFLKMKSYVEQLERLDYTIGELHALLIQYEKGLPKKAATPQVLTIHGGRILKPNKKPQAAKGKGKGKGKGRNKIVYASKSINLKHVAKEHPTKDDAWHHCKEVCHWRRNCPVDLAELMKKKHASSTSTSGIFAIELFSFPNKSSVYDTSCGTHICNTTRGLKGERKMKQATIYLYMVNGVHAQVEAITARGVVSVSRLVDNEFIQRLTNYGILVSKNDILYFNVIPHDGIYEIDMLNLVPNVNSIYNVSKKRAKHNLDSTYLWHYLLAHISKKRIGKLYHDGLLKSTDSESFDQCVSCLSVFKNKVENQLEKTIKALQSDQGGEYISQQFKDYPKACGIVQQLTPPYTPQHNDVSERRNRTLLDMVWGCDALVKRDTPDKLQQRSIKCIFVGYPKETMGYYFYRPPKNKIVVARYAEFFENNLVSQEANGRAVKLEEIQDKDTSPSENTSEHLVEAESFEPPQEDVSPARRFIRTHRAPERLCLNAEVEYHSLGDLNEPTNYKAALLNPESNKWLDAMNAKMQSLKDNQVWRLLDLPPNAKTVASKWLFKKKTDMDRNICKCVVRPPFLNGYLDEDIYMVQPGGFIDPKHPRKVCKLQGSIYGLKQASRSWNKRFDEEIKKFGFSQNLDEPCVYQKASRSNVTFLILYVDDIIIMGSNILMLQSVKSYLESVSP
ncbi:retrotransposon protein, putative, ty1-copia subclass [Tanacetum coccineum]